jgi:membrane protein DedA with SNARE-associated domain
MSFQQIILLLTTYKYFFLFPVAVVEGPIITVIAGFLSSLGHLNIFIAYGVIVVGDIVGDSMYYALGYYGRQRFIERWGRFLGITMERVERLEKHFKKHSGKTILFGKWTHSVGFAILIVAGMIRMPFKRFIWFNFFGSLPKLLVFFIIGYYFGQAYQQIDKYFTYATLSVFFVIILMVGIYLFVKKFKNKVM